MPTINYREPGTGIMRQIVSGTNDHGQLNGLTDNDHPQYALRADALGRNKAMNGSFRVNQRGGTSSSASNVFIFDRWRQEYGGGTMSYSSVAANPGELPESARTFARLAVSGQSAVTDYGVFVHVIEDVRTLSGKTVTVSFWAKAASGTPKVAVELAQDFAQISGGSTWNTGNTGQITLSTTWARYSVTLTLPSLAGKTIGTGGTDCLILFMWVSAGSNWSARTGSFAVQNNTFDFWGVQVEEGALATAFEHKAYDQELVSCQRYFYRIQGTADVAFNGWAAIGSGQFQTATSARCHVDLPAPMRKQPILSVGGTCVANTNNTPFTWSTISSVFWSPNTPGKIFFDVPVAGAQAGWGASFYTERNSTNYLDFNAEY